MSALPPSTANLPHDSLGPRIVALCSAMIGLATVVVFARFWIRLGLVRARLEAHDWCILAAWASAVGFASIGIYQTKIGLGRHIWDVHSNFTTVFIYIQELTYVFCVAVTKVAVLLLYLRIAVQKRDRVVMWSWLVIVVMFAFACILAVIFQCTPIPKAWEKIGTVPGHCININASLFAHAVLNIFQDAVTYVLPMRMLYALQIPRRQKIALVLIFALGGFVTITGIVRIGSLKSALRTPDPFYDNAGAVMWSSVECNVGVVCASLPHFKPFLDRYLPSLMRGRSREPSKTAPVLKGPIMKSVGTSTKQGYERQPESPDLELGHRDTCGTGDSYEGGYNYSINAGGNPRFGVSSSEEHLRDLEAQDSKRGIYKSTTVSVGTKS